MNRLSFTESSASQQYATHNYFRYFGKLPPVVVEHVLELGSVTGEPFLDLMCGSGTSLVEANFRRIEAVGVDVNPLSTLIARVKTTPLNVNELQSICNQLFEKVDADLRLLSFSGQECLAPLEVSYVFEERPEFRNKDYWFSVVNEMSLVVIKHHVDAMIDDAVREFFLVAFFSIIRRASNASPRTGRIFRVKDPKPVNVFALFQKKCAEMLRGMSAFCVRSTLAPVRVILEDARHTTLPSEHFGFILNHPPYFALYKYSSDVLRFELEWGKYDRTPIVKGEIRDGFKTTNVAMLDAYISDMGEVFKEAYRLLRAGRLFCVVVNDSTLKNIQLPVISRLIAEAENVGFSVEDHKIRDVMFSQARYHQSANAAIQTKEDHLIFFRK